MCVKFNREIQQIILLETSQTNTVKIAKGAYISLNQVLIYVVDKYLVLCVLI